MRMKPSNDRPNGSRNALNAAALRSTSSAVAMPSASAARTFFSEFSSVPVRKWTSRPRSRPYLASTSASTSSIANPMCGLAFT